MLRRDLLTAALLGGPVLALHPGRARAEPPKRGGTLLYATGTDALTLDPQFVTDIPTARAVMQIYETLVQQDPDGTIRPGLATSWQTAGDRRSWTFSLRPGVKFQDGTPFDAEAVKFTFGRIQDPATGSPRRSAAGAVQEVRVVDPHTVTIVTREPYAPLLASLSAYNLAIISPTQARKEGKRLREAPVGTGPFRLKSWRPGEKLALAANEGWWGGRPLLNGLEFRVVPEDSARALLLLTGEADMASAIPIVMLKRLQASPAVKILRKTGFRTIYVGLNNKVAPFSDIRVRQAVAHAIDVKALLQGVLGGIGTLGGGIESPVIDGAIRLPPYEYDPGQARKLLAEAGLAKGFETEFYVPTGRYLMDRELGQAIQAQLAEVGIRAKIQSPDWATFSEIVDHKKAPMFLLGKGSPTGDLDFTLTLTDSSAGRMNDAALDDKDLDRLINEQRGTMDPAARRALLKQAQERIYADYPYVVLFYEDQIFGTRSDVHDVEVYANELLGFSHAWKG